jgi:hypothetical protein
MKRLLLASSHTNRRWYSGLRLIHFALPDKVKQLWQ